MDFRRYTHKALETVSAEVKALMKQTDREDMQNVFYVWHDLRADIERELDRRTIRVHANEDIRQMIKDKRLHHYEIAALIGIDNCTFSKWLRTPLNEERRQAVLNAITKLS